MNKVICDVCKQPIENDIDLIVVKNKNTHVGVCQHYAEQQSLTESQDVQDTELLL